MDVNGAICVGWIAGFIHMQANNRATFPIVGFASPLSSRAMYA